MMRPLVEGLDLCICGSSEARSTLGAPANTEDDSLHVQAARWLTEAYGISKVATPIRSGETA